MPRPNKPREIFAEDHLAQRIASERDRPERKWTNDGLAKRMTDAGCPMTGSAIFKIEKSEPRRRIVVDELVTFAKVFGVRVEELLSPPELWAAKQITPLLEEWKLNIDRHLAAEERFRAKREELEERIGAVVVDFPGARDFISQYFEEAFSDLSDMDATLPARIADTLMKGH